MQELRRAWDTCGDQSRGLPSQPPSPRLGFLGRCVLANFGASFWTPQLPLAS